MKNKDFVTHGKHAFQNGVHAYVQHVKRRDFKFMTTFLKHTEIPRAGNSETMIRTFRQMEKTRYGFKTESGLQDHLKLFQLKNSQNFAENTGQAVIFTKDLRMKRYTKREIGALLGGCKVTETPMGWFCVCSTNH